MSTCPVPWKERHTKAEANALIRDMRSRAKRSKANSRAVEVYQCTCKAWHIAGSQTRRHA